MRSRIDLNNFKKTYEGIYTLIIFIIYLLFSCSVLMNIPGSYFCSYKLNKNILPSQNFFYIVLFYNEPILPKKGNVIILKRYGMRLWGEVNQ
jgi:hypothetical protein